MLTHPAQLKSIYIKTQTLLLLLHRNEALGSRAIARAFQSRLTVWAQLIHAVLCFARVGAIEHPSSIMFRVGWFAVR